MEEEIRKTKAIARGVLYALAVVTVISILAAFVGCTAGTVATSTGTVVPAATVQAQDLAADTLKLLDSAYLQAGATHDSLVTTDNPTTHAARRALLMQFHDGLVAAWAAEIAWRQTSTGSAVPPAVLCALKPTLPAFLDLALGFKLLTAAQVGTINTFAAPILAATGGC